MLRHHHDDNWRRPLRRSRSLPYEISDQRLKHWEDPPPPTPLGKAWEARVQERSRLERLEQELAIQRQRLEDLEERGAVRPMEIHTFAPEPYRVKKPIPIIVRPLTAEFLASFVDANVNASGETEQEAFEAVKTLLLDMLDQLARQPRLGPKLAARLSVLREFIDEPPRT
jgi:hypothetical protein